MNFFIWLVTGLLGSKFKSRKTVLYGWYICWLPFLVLLITFLMIAFFGSPRIFRAFIHDCLIQSFTRSGHFSFHCMTKSRADCTFNCQDKFTNRDRCKKNGPNISYCLVNSNIFRRKLFKMLQPAQYIHLTRLVHCFIFQ